MVTRTIAVVMFAGLVGLCNMFNSVFASSSNVMDDVALIATDATHANWVFSGLVANESGDQYDYLFQLQRHDTALMAQVALFDAQTKQIVFKQEEQGTFQPSHPYDWQAGSIFMRFNPINATWIFGSQNQHKNGFNFKIDMLQQINQMPTVQHLREGLTLVVSQTGALSGHIRVGDAKQEEFVTAKNAWFRHVWASHALSEMHQLNGVLCRFDDGGGFYSMHMSEPDALQAAIAGGFDAAGEPTVMSQFVRVKQGVSDGLWDIRVSSPNMHLVLTDVVKQQDVVAGFFAEKNKQGFCMLSDNAIG